MAHATRRTLGLILLAGWTAALAACSSDTTADGLDIRRVGIGGETFRLEVADTPEARFQGLSDRPEIAENGGMLFVFPDERERYFVMRRCLVPIDILFLAPDGTVLNTHAMRLEPPGTPEEDLERYASDGRTAIAIELAGGTIERLGVGPGDRVELPIRELKRNAR
ncbi:MAG: DUF192 domain-containing protein [Planctomycetota bacterium]